jgi:hypothetical protein
MTAPGPVRALRPADPKEIRGIADLLGRADDELEPRGRHEAQVGLCGVRRRASHSSVTWRSAGPRVARLVVRERLNGTAAAYLIGPRGPEYRRSDPAGTIRWYCMDGLGSVLAEVDPIGALTASRKYVYGGVRASSGS